MYRRYLILSLVIILSGCITSSQNKEEKRVSIYFKANQIGEPLTIDSQSITVEEFKFSLDRFNLHAGEDVVLQSSSDVTAMIFAYEDQNSEEKLILDVGLGFTDVNLFNGYEIFLEPVANRSGVLDEDFFGEDENYSVIIKGEVDGADFDFRSSSSFETLFTFDNVELDSRNETLVIEKTIDLEQVFQLEGGGFLDPMVPENEPLIIENIQSSLQVEAAALSAF